VLRDVLVAVGRAGENVDHAAVRAVALAAPATFQNLGALVFGDHTLDLQQEVVLRGLAERAIEEDDLDAGAPQFVDE